MGIDADAYMAGAIPSLNRGGSWQQDPQATSSMHSYAPGSSAGGGSIFPRPSQIVPPPMGNRSNAHFSQHPWPGRQPFHLPNPAPQLSMGPPSVPSSAGSQVSGAMVSGAVPPVVPTKHPGWANLHAGGYRSSPTSPTAPASTANVIAGHATSRYGIAPGSQRGAPTAVPQRTVEPLWEWDSGSPKPLTAEPDYFALPLSPGAGGHASVPHTPTRVVAPQLDSLPPPPRPAPQSPRPRTESHRVPKPKLTRRHTHDRYSPSVEAAIERSGDAVKVDSKSLGRVRGKSRLAEGSVATIDSEASGSYYAPSSKTYAQSIDPPSSAASTANATHVKSRNSPSHRSATASLAMSTAAPGTHRSFAERRFKNRSHPGLATIASSSTIDFTQTAPSTANGSRAHPGTHHPSLDMRSLRDALPQLQGVDQAGPPMTAQASGYVDPTSDEDYDRYVAHPAAPVPPRADLPSDHQATMSKPPTGAGLKKVTPDSYRPPGFPKPLKEIGWNRNGPAMRTYGIAWLREGTAEELPGRPAGPRWIQARPPPSTAQSGTTWGASGS